ncbi:O-succinylhomoserine sulfhydrylase [Candidatus Planktophila dulcis]|uniref:O-succinylhomoserine sulfhydrylase n=1 Tax=Candidatus Planktophila dulcis TaxID=1884914 RepID=A0AAC9YUQ9_9ACTN|nr:O-succinylhomoserine sulfhydrylase [Candidatus Planktophila dulcis]ASY12525.1 O-succinylhomoserine sulfhydrylase [Candidatus Planktophila dulcis]ASY21772.1 O-succinylhomoserine sulfhydrylase [Candidatus Planktophila dulcis]
MSKEVWGYHEHPKRREPDWEINPQTAAVREGLARSGFGETSEALFLNSGFTYANSQEAVDSFTDETDHFLYSRFHNPTVAMFEKRLAAIEGAEHCVATGSGMAAMFASLACLVEAGDHIVASAAMFSSCHVVITEILPKWGVTYELVKANDKAAWEKALTKPTKAVFIESPSNPLLEIVDIRFVSDLAHKVGATVIVDNVMASPVLQKPLELGADVVMYSATKHIDGQGRVLAGALLGSFEYIYEKLIPFTRHTGPSLSAFNAWVLVKSLETMELRVTRMCENAQKLAEFLETRKEIKSVRYPGLASHPDRDVIKKQMKAGGTTIGIEFAGTQKDAFRFMDALRVIDISNNLGDSKSLITHPASTTHRRLAPDVLLEMGITPSVIRLSVGLEHIDDLLKDVTQALNS